jgi:hypothetical protein
MFYGFQSTRTTKGAPCGAVPVIRLSPCPNDTELRQGLIGADLLAGYQGELLVDNVQIPAEELRTGGPNQIYFQPGPGTITGALAPGRHTATLIFWSSTKTKAEGDQQSWPFLVT